MGTVVTPPVEDAHWDAERANMGERTRFIEVRFERLYDEPVLLADELATEPFNGVRWFSQTPVIYVPDEVFAAVEDRSR